MNVRFRHIVLLATAAMLATACSHDTDIASGNGGGKTPVPETETPIVFAAQLQDGLAVTNNSADGGSAAVTRAPLSDITDMFTVYGYKNTSSEDGSNPVNYTAPQQVFPGYTVKWEENSVGTTVTNSDGWEYVNMQQTGQLEQTIKYWDWDVTAYRFFGYAGTGVTVTTSPAADPTSVVLTLTVPAAETNPQSEPVTLPVCPYYSKLWFSNGSLVDYPNRQFGKPVQLEFLKPYVKVRFLFKSADESVDLDDLNIDLPSFKPTNSAKTIATAGTFTVTYPLTGTATEESLSVTATTATLPSSQGFSVPDKWYVVLPALAENQGSYTLSVEVKGEEKTAVVPAEFMGWRPGYEYTYIFKVTDNVVALYDVLAGFAQWDESASPHTVYNW